MSKIQTIMPNHFGDHKNRNASREVIPPMTRKRSQNLSFGGEANNITKFTENSTNLPFKGNASTVKTKVEEFMHKKMGLTGWFSRLFYNTRGEVQNQLGNAAFTSTLAPLMIACNPFSDQDKDTKKYSAWRQPISAVIAIGIGWPLTWAYENWMKKMALKGDINNIDLRIMKPESEYEKEFEKYSKSAGGNAKYDTLKKYAEAKNSEMAKGYAEKYVFSDADSVLENAEKDLKAGKINKQEFKKIKITLDSNNLDKQSFQDFMKDEFKFKFTKSEGQKFLNVEDYNKKLDDIKALDFLNKLGLIDDNIKEEDLRLFLLEKKQKSQAIKMAEAKGVPINSKEFEESLKDIITNGKLASRNIEFYMGPIKGNKISLGQFLEVLEMNKTFKGDLDNSLVEDLKAELKANNIENSEDLFLTKKSNSMKAVLTEFKNKLKELKTMDKKEFKDFAIQITKNKGSKAINDFKNIKNYTSIAFNLILTAISCTVLNWAYPRFMEKFFPKLSQVKKQGGNK